MGLTYSLNKHPQGYGLEWYECLYGLVISPYAARHFDLAESPKTRDSHRLGHRILAAIQFVPILGAIVAIIERVAVAIFYAFKGNDVPSPKKQPAILSISTQVGIPAQPPLPTPHPATSFQFNPAYLPKLRLTEAQANDKMVRNFGSAIREKRRQAGTDFAEVVPDISKIPPQRKPIIPLEFVSSDYEKQGRRPEMEDAHFHIKIDGVGTLAGVFDGHGDKGKVSKYAAEAFQKYFPIILQHTAHAHEALKTTFKHVLAEIAAKCEEGAFDGGSTGLVCFIDTQNRIYTAALGDTEAKIYRKIDGELKSIPLTCVRTWHSKADVERVRKHYKDDPDSFKLFLRDKGKERYVYGDKHGVNVSRGFGDVGISAVGRDSVTTTHFLEEGDLLVLACDGVWDFADEKELMEECIGPVIENYDPELDELIPERKSARRIAEYAYKTCESTDNISVVTLFARRCE